MRDNFDEKFHPVHGVINEEIADRAGAFVVLPARERT